MEPAMLRCLPWPWPRCLSGRGARARAGHGQGLLGGDSRGGAPGDGTGLQEALERFRAGGREAALAAGACGAAAPLADAACQLVEALVLGICEHLPELRAEARAEAPAAAPASLVVRFASPARVVGEIVTRSRVAMSVCVEEELRFVLRCPPPSPEGLPLVLQVEGLEMPALPDAVRARTQLRKELGACVDPMSAYRWWERHRHRAFPLQTSKFHRVVESLLEQRGMKMLGTKVCADSFWGYLHTTDLHIDRFEFLPDRRLPGGVSMTARMRPPRTPEEAEDRERVREITHRMLRGHRSSAERLAPSGISVGAMLSGAEVGQPGACPRVVAKLLSPARWWGPGTDGWHRHDDSWLCTDRKNSLGRTLEAQGRVIWRLEGQAGACEPCRPGEPAVGRLGKPPSGREEPRCRKGARGRAALLGRFSKLRRAAAHWRRGNERAAPEKSQSCTGAPRRGVGAMAALVRAPRRTSCWPRRRPAGPR